MQVGVSQPTVSDRLGVVAAIGDAMVMVARRPSLMSVPLVLDAWVWLGIRLEPSWLNVPTGPRRVIALSGLDRDLTNVLALLSPSLLAGVSRETYAATLSGLTLRIGGPTPSLVVLSVGVLIAAVASIIMRLQVATLIKPDVLSTGPAALLTIMFTRRYLLLKLLAILIMTLLIGPVLVVSGLAGWIGFDAWPVLLFVLAITAIMGRIALTFAPEAIVLSHAPPARAIKLSFTVVREHFGTTIRLVSYQAITRLGLAALGLAIAVTPIGVFIAVIIHAFLATTMVMATALLYQDRVAKLSSSPANEIAT